MCPVFHNPYPGHQAYPCAMVETSESDLEHKRIRLVGALTMRRQLGGLRGGVPQRGAKCVSPTTAFGIADCCTYVLTPQAFIGAKGRSTSHPCALSLPTVVGSRLTSGGLPIAFLRLQPGPMPISISHHTVPLSFLGRIWFCGTWARLSLLATFIQGSQVTITGRRLRCLLTPT